jgi:PBSX family phage portal protein
MTDKDPKEVTVFTAKRPQTRTLAPSTDPFLAKGDDLKALGGMDANVRRRHSRSMEKAYTGADKTGTKQLDSQGLIDAYNLFGVMLPPYNLDYLARIYEMSAPHYAAVKAKVANIAGLGFDFVDSPAARQKLDQTKSERTKKSIRANIDREKGELYTWLDECNAEDEFGETLQKVWTDYETMGNGYLEIGRGLDGMVKYIGHIPAATMRVRKDRDGFVQMVADRVVFFRNFGDTETTDPVGNDPRPNEVLHIKKYSPTNTYYGIPDIIAAQQAVVGNEFSARFNLDYFENKAVPRYVIVLKGASFSDTAQANLLEFFETGLKGQNHRTLFVPLPPDDTEQKVEFEMKPIEAGTQDSSFGNYRDSNLQEILMAHRVPLSKVTSAKGVSLANARDADKTFKESVCRPEQSMLEKKLNRIIREVTEVVKLKLNELSLTDEDMLSAMDERYLRMNVMVPDDIRVRRWGWEALPGGDKVLDVMKKPEAAAEAKTQASGNRERDQQRTANATDSKGEGRNEQGAGRTQE